MNRIEQLVCQARHPEAQDAAPRPWADRSPVWAEPFCEAWAAHDGCDYRVRFARAQAAELAAARPYIRPGELIIGGDRLAPIVTGRETPFGNGIRLDAARAVAMKAAHPEQGEGIDAVVAYWRQWLGQNGDRPWSTRTRPCCEDQRSKGLKTVGDSPILDRVEKARCLKRNAFTWRSERMDKAIVIFLAVLLFIGLAANWGGKGSVGQPPPQFELKDINGQTVSLAQYKGKVVLIDFWATWCPPCRGEIPNMKKVYAQYKSKGFEIIGLSLDRSEKDLKDYIQKNGVTWRMVFVGNNTQVCSDYHVRAIPSLFVVDRAGNLRYKKVRGQEINKAVEELVNEKAPAPASAS